MMDKLANLELSVSAVLFCIFGILLIVGLTILGLYLYLSSKSKSDLAAKYQGKKMKSPIVAAGQYPDVNPFRWRGTLVSFGVALALLTTLVSFGATQYDEQVFIPDDALALDEELEIEPPRTTEPPPPPPPPPPPVIEEVAEEELEEEDDIEFTDEDIDEDEVIEEIVEEEVEEEEVEVVEVEEEEEEEIFMIVEQSPRFPGCEDMDGSKEEKEACAQKKMLEYIYGNLKYPAIARENGIEGQVVIQFVVDKDGSINDINLVRNLEGGCGEAALKVVKGMNNLPQKWTPGKQRGRAVKVKYTLPVKFKLEG
jgi:protein TonB